MHDTNRNTNSLGDSAQPNDSYLLQPLRRLFPAKHGAWTECSPGCTAPTMGLCETTAGQDVQDESSWPEHSTDPRVAARPVPPGPAIIADIISLLPQLSEEGLRRVRAEVDIVLSLSGREGTDGTIS